MNPNVVQEPIHESSGPSCSEAIAWFNRTVEHRRQRVLACLADGPAEFEKVRPPGYRTAHWRCRRCHILRRHHVA